MALYGPPPSLVFFLIHLLLLQMLQLSVALMDTSDCPLDLSGSNFTLAASVCSAEEDRGKCCRYINFLIAISAALYANQTDNLGVNLETSEVCRQIIARTLHLHGVSRAAIVLCGFGTKIPVNYGCQGRTTVSDMVQSPKFSDVAANCNAAQVLDDSHCKKCLNSGISFLRDILGSPPTNTTLSTCRDATFVALASRADNASALDLGICFFGVQGLVHPTVSVPSPAIHPQQVSPSPEDAASPTQFSILPSTNEERRQYHLTLVPMVGIAVIVLSVVMLYILSVLIRRTNKLVDFETDKISSKQSKVFSPGKFQEGSSGMFREFSYKETKKATNNFSTIIGKGGFSTVFKAEFQDGFVAAVKRMDKVSKQAENDFCREIELLARLHHRHLVNLRGFCVRKHERFLMYEYMANGSLHDHLHCAGMTPLNWCTRIQIAIDVANALEYLHFYCNPPLCHRDIKSSNILLDENYVAKVADFGIIHASKDGSISFEPVITDIKGTPGYMDPEYVITQEVSGKSDIYSYGVIVLELVSGRKAIQDNKNLVEWAQAYITSDSRITGLVDPTIGDSFDYDQLLTLVAIIRGCTQREGRARPSIKQVLRLLYECADPMHNVFVDEYDEVERRGRANRPGGALLPSSSSTSRSRCSRSVVNESGSPDSHSNLPSDF
ncbi:hypothetical protein DM860_015191 [Cuscuta australis]|uniref:Protein kinase domain-containing protein n=1 Tax=Cuscuta australis TaxID=267555 RepID=A0A328D1H9_9ASTE|nr:hypothetical protein DM860_015191 [Cuscuta australis]